MILRPYQSEIIAKIKHAYASGAKAPLLVLPTGGGKTVIFAHICRTLLASGKRALVLVHRRELIKQASDKLAAIGVQHGIIAPGYTTTRDAIQVASVQTLARRLERHARDCFDIVIIDEAHHAVAGTWERVLRRFRSARFLGVTATPERLDRRGLRGTFDTLIAGPNIRELIDLGFLVPAEVYAPPEMFDTSKLPKRRGDWTTQDLDSLLDAPRIFGCAIEHYGRLCPGQPAIAFCVSVKTATLVAQQFRAAGWRAVAVDGSMPAQERDRALAGLANGSVHVVTSCDLISEGLDVPAVGAVILLRPTQSLALYLQQVGRGLRPAPGKTRLIVLDHAGNALRHGLPDAPREWTLDGAKPSAPNVKQCPKCFAVHKPMPFCPHCGYRYAVKKAERNEEKNRRVEYVPGTLVRIDQANIDVLRNAPLRELLRRANTEEDLRRIAHARGYKPGWVWHIQRTRGQRMRVVR